MFELIVLLLHPIALICRGHEDIVLENVALRHQLRTLQRTVKRPHLRTRDRILGCLGDRLAAVAIGLGPGSTRPSYDGIG